MNSDESMPGLTVNPGPGKGPPLAVMEVSPGDDLDLPLRVLAGTLPSDLLGHVFYSGPKATLGQPVFASSGLIWRLDLGPEPRLLRKPVENISMLAKKAVDDEHWFGSLRDTLYAFRDAGSGFMMSLLLGAVTTQNIAPIPVGDELMLVTSDNGRPYVLNPRTLQVVRPMGLRSDWKAALPGVSPFGVIVTTAHPMADKVGETEYVYSTNFAPRHVALSPFTHLVRWNVHTSELEHFRLIDQSTGQEVVIDMTLHQMAVTDRWVVLLESAYILDMWLLILRGLTYAGVPSWLLDAVTSKPDYPFARFWIIDKQALPKGGTPEDPVDVLATAHSLAGEAFHFTAAYDDADGLKLFVLHNPTQDLAHYLGPGEPMLDGSTAKPGLNGWFVNNGLIPADLGFHVLHPEEGTVESSTVGGRRQTWSIGVENLRYNEPSWPHRKNARMFLTSGGFQRADIPVSFYEKYASRSPPVQELPEFSPGSVFAVITEDQTLDSWPLPAGWIPWTPTFVPKCSVQDGKLAPDGEPCDTRGYLLVTAVSDAGPGLPEGSSGTEIWVFDSGDIAKGPICRLGHPDLKIGVAVHSCYVTQIESFGDGPAYDVREDFDLKAMREEYEKVVPRWMPLRRLWTRGVRKALDWKRMEQLFEQRIYPAFTPKKGE